jgi:hypothetical protein
VHERARVVNMLGAENVSELVDQREHGQIRFGTCALVVKNSIYRHDDVVRQTLRAVADAVDAGPSGADITRGVFTRERDDQIVTSILR